MIFLYGMLRFTDREFVAEAYHTVLLREADSAGLDHYVGMLCAGMSRRWVLRSIRTSPEANAVGVPYAEEDLLALLQAPASASITRANLLASRGRQVSAAAPAQAWDIVLAAELAHAPYVDGVLCFTDREFVESAYRIILLRPADPQGLDEHLGSLRSGTSRIELLHGLRGSPEGMAAGVDVADSDVLLRMHASLSQRAEHPLRSAPADDRRAARSVDTYTLLARQVRRWTQARDSFG